MKLKVLIGLSTLLAVCAQAEKRPNVLFIVADDLQASLGCYGASQVHTPCLDGLAREGMVFERAYAQGSYCVPSRKSFLTGLSTRTVGCNNSNYYRDHPDCLTMGRFFRANGYETFSIGKSEHNMHPKTPSEGSWDHYHDEQEYGPGERLSRDDMVEDLQTEAKPRSMTTTGVYDLESHTAYRKVSHAIGCLENKRDKSKPFFMVLGFHKPHTPWISAKPYYDLYDPAELIPFQHPADMTSTTEVMLHREPFLFSAARQRDMLKSYYACVSTIDSQIGRILNHLRDQGMLDNTLVAFTADQGYHLGYRKQWNKHNLYEEIARVPLIVRYPSVVQGASRSRSIVELLDLFPTFADLAGLKIPNKLDGISLKPVLRNPDQSVKDAAYIEIVRRIERNGKSVNIKGRAVRTDRWRYIEWGDEGKELYDHRNDPQEFYNLSGHPECQPVIKKHQQLIREWFEK